MGSIWSQRIISMCCTKIISITFLRFYDFVRLSIVISFQKMFSNSTHKWHPYNQMYVGVRSDPPKLLQCSHLKKPKSFLNCKINVRTGFLDPGNKGKDTKIDFLSQISRKFYGVLNILLIWLVQPFYFLVTKQKSCSRVLEWHFSHKLLKFHCKNFKYKLLSIWSVCKNHVFTCMWSAQFLPQSVLNILSLATKYP